MDGERQTLAEARHRTYSLVGRLVLDGLVPEVRAVVGALPELDGAVDGEDPEGWAVAHQRTWGFEVAPYESVFRSEEGLLGGAVGGRVAAAHERSGIRVGRSDTEPDHLGLELAHLAFLCAAERDALVDGLPDAADRLVALQRGFLEQHLLTWLPAVLGAVVASGGAFDRALSGLIAELVADHAVELGISGDSTGSGPAPTGLDAVLDDPKTGVKRLTELLVRPSVAGWWLSTGRIGALATEAGVPGGFGSRAKKLESVVFAAVDHGALPALVTALQGEVSRWQAHYDGVRELGLPVAAWTGRLSHTAAALDRLEQASRLASPEHPTPG